MSFSHRYIGNPFLSGLGRIFFRTNISDFHCGLRAFQKCSIEKLNLCTTGMEFASEMVVKAVLSNLKITEIPCKLYPDGRDRPPHLRSIPDGLRHLEFLLLYSPKWLFAYPGVVLTVLGVFFMILIYVHPIQVGHIQFEVTTMLYSAIAVLIGAQMLQFSVFAHLFGKRIGQFPEYSKFIFTIEALANRCGYWIAFAFIVFGLIGCVYTFYEWAKVDFGILTNTWVCKTAILFGTLLAVGFEMLLFTLFTRVLQIGGYDEK